MNIPEMTEEEVLAAEIRRAVIPTVAGDILWHEMTPASQEAYLRAAKVAREIVTQQQEKLSDKRKAIDTTGIHPANAGGEPCPKCLGPMLRKSHPQGWKPKPTQEYYFEYWDVCKKCPHMQHYESAKRYNPAKSESRVIERTSEWIGTPEPYPGAAPWE